MLQFKPEVRIVDGAEPLWPVLRECCIWSLRTGVGVEVNSIDDGVAVHMATSLHSFDLALDVDTLGDNATETAALGAWLARRLHPQYDVVLEGDHVHVEWDAHRGLSPKAVG
jgi:hypothetical protein